MKKKDKKWKRISNNKEFLLNSVDYRKNNSKTLRRYKISNKKFNKSSDI